MMALFKAQVKMELVHLSATMESGSKEITSTVSNENISLCCDSMAARLGLPGDTMIDVTFLVVVEYKGGRGWHWSG